MNSKRLQYIREKRIIEQSNLCIWCGERMLPTSTSASSNPFRPTIEHIIPRNKGGNNLAPNLVVAHAVCNGKRGVFTNIKPNDEAFEGLDTSAKNVMVNSLNWQYELVMIRSVRTPEFRKVKRIV